MCRNFIALNIREKEDDRFIDRLINRESVPTTMTSYLSHFTYLLVTIIVNNDQRADAQGSCRAVS
jgi:hypothetical protein